jgi:hypothetical protein
MTQPPCSVREERNEELVNFSSDLAEACRRCDPANGNATEWVRAALSGECLKCSIRVTGEELLAISTSAEDPKASAKVKRMRLGYCARDGCRPLNYRLEFRDLPGLDWQVFVAQLEAVKEHRIQLAAAEAAARQAAKHRINWHALRRFGIALVIILLLLIIRQWYLGGRIPILREPEKFRVTPSLAEHENPRE